MNFSFLTILLVSNIYCTLNAQESETGQQEEESPEREIEFNFFNEHENPHLGEGPDDISKNRNVVAYGISEKENENMTKTAIEIGLKLGIIKPQNHIVRAYRLKCPLRARPVVVKLRSTELKDKWVYCYARRGLYDLGFRMEADGEETKIEQLEEQTKKWAKKKNYAVWTLLSEVLYKKTNDSPVYKVNDVKHLHEIVDNESKSEVTHRILTLFYRNNASQAYVPTFFNYTGPTPRTGSRPRRQD